MLRVRYYKLEDSLIKTNIKVVNMSDIHSNVQYLNDALEYALKIDADIITIPGDLFDSVDNAHNAEIVEILKRVENTQIYISNGNHDLVRIQGRGPFAKLTYEPDKKYYESLNSAKNIHVFLNNSDKYFYKSVEIVALDPGQDWYDKTCENEEVFKSILDEYLSGLDKGNTFRLMLLHSCNGLISKNKLESELAGINLVLSGHNHACLTPEFIQSVSKTHRGLFGPYNKFFMQGSYGTWTKGNTSVILSNGLTKMGESHGSKIVRNLVNNVYKSDIDIIELTHGESHSLKLSRKYVQK